MELEVEALAVATGGLLGQGVREYALSSAFQVASSASYLKNLSGSRG